ncbi:MAG TPA: CGGC domain-containing protein [Syntrophomonadaceae bacterium]|nr:CGGC domain-containing protein [Syntrophomonadaceae bacterium]
MKWTDEALKEIEKAPSFVRGMAKKAVENEVYKAGRDEINREDVRNVRNKYFSFAEEKKDKKKTKIAVVRCEIVSEVCPGVACFMTFNSKRMHFAEYDENTEMVGFFTCGGCPGRRVSRLVGNLKKHGLDVVHLSSCMLLEGDYPRCPHVAEIKAMIESKGIKVVEGTHH